MDKEYEVLEYISSSDDVTQRDISEHLGISLGSVNLLLKKMIKEGLIKIEKIPANRVAYMLTPKGMQEKIAKTVNYIKIHYKAIERYKKNIRNFLNQVLEDNIDIKLHIKEIELKDLFTSVSSEYHKLNLEVLQSLGPEEIDDKSIYILDYRLEGIESKNVYNIKKII